jgi:hypothetical protein
VLFLYLHVYFQLKTSDDLEIYEIDNPSKDKLEEICDLRQPVLFQFQNDRLFESCQRSAILDTYGAFDIKIRNVKQSTLDNEHNLYVPLAFSNALKVIREDTDNKYLVENNSEFLEETGLVKSFKYNDVFLRPYMVSNCGYDFLFAADGTRTPFKYDLNYRHYLLVTEGDIKVKLTQPKSSKYLYQQRDYENFEFTSPLNPWQIQGQYKADFDKIKCLDIAMKRGQILYIPAYWWYSIEFGKEASLCSFKYKTYMNMVAILPQLVMKVLQTQNVKRNTMATVQQAAPLLAAEPLLAAAHVSAAHVSAAHVSAAHVSAAHVSAAHVQQAPTTTYIEPIQDTLIETMTPLPLAAPFNGENTFLETTKV